MRSFHIDFNTAAWKEDYLEKFLTRLIHCGYDTVIWELEDSIKWESCPESAAPDALTKKEFSHILNFSRSLGLKNVPLLQSLSHCEYVLRHKEYQHLAENPGSFSPYCPSHPQLVSFLGKWIREYLEIFYDAEYFHLGCDEAWGLGDSCETCRNTIGKQGKSQLIVDHINRLSMELIPRGVAPIIWADMALIHPEAIGQLSRQIVLFDWRYEVYHGNGKIWCWDEKGGHLCTPEEIPTPTRKHFFRWLYPHGDEPGREPELFYTAHYLKDLGFKVVLCPSTSCAGDNVFAGRTWLHIQNVFDFLQAAKTFDGYAVTSWTVHLFPYELQPGIDLPNFHGSLDDFPLAYSREMFGLEHEDFFIAAGLLAKKSLFTSLVSTGHDKTFRTPAKDYAAKLIRRKKETETLEQELQNSRARLTEYHHARELFDSLCMEAKKNKELLAIWKLAAENLVFRAEFAIFAIEYSSGVNPTNKKTLLARLDKLKTETARHYHSVMRPHRVEEIIDILFGSIEYTLKNEHILKK